MITKELFIGLIKALRDQRDYDFGVTNTLGEIYKTDINPYNTSILTDAIFTTVENSIPGTIEQIKIFCFEMDYGRFIDTKGCPIEELWEEIKTPEISQETVDKILDYSKHIVSTHSLIDDYPDTTSLKDIEVTYQLISPLPNRKLKTPYYSIEDED